MQSFQPHEFLACVLPTGADYHYCAFELPSRNQVFVGSIEALANTCELASVAGKNSFYAMGAFRTSESRTSANVVAIKALFFDVDCGPGKAYETKNDAVGALQDFLQQTGLNALGTPWLLDSGGGVHGYFPFEEALCPDDWRPIAEAFKRTAARLGFKIDMTVTADAARVLRMPGTLNYKYAPARPVRIKVVGSIFAPYEIYNRLDRETAPARNRTGALALAGVAPTKPRAKADTSPVMQALVNNSVTYFKNIMVRTAQGTGCGQLKHFVDNAEDDGMEPLWRGLLSLTRVCVDGDKAAARLSALHPYPEARMRQKLAEIKGPYPCVKLDSENPGVCGACPHWGKITNPLALGRDIATTREAEEYRPAPETAAQFHPGDTIQKPVPPLGFSYGQQGGVFRSVVKKDDLNNEFTDNVLVTPFSFFLLDVLSFLHPTPEHIARFVAIKAKTVISISIDLKDISKKDTCISRLFSQNIIAAFGAGNDKNLWDYVRACVEERSAQDKILRIPPRLGWQTDNSFAVGDRVIAQHGLGYDFPAAAMRNLTSTLQPKGTLSDWQRFASMLQQKQLWDVLGIMAVGFGAPLMQFANAGTPFTLFHACSDVSGSGKSLALKAAASIWGDPLHYPIPPDTSRTTMMQRMGMIGSLPFLCDEVTAQQRRTKGEFIPELAFSITQGMHKLRGTAGGNSEIENESFWRGSGVITSNEPTMEKLLTARMTTSNGEFYRMLEWHADTALAWTEQERGMIDVLHTNYGVAGRIYAEWLVNNRDKAIEVTQQCIERVRVLTRAADVERFWVSGVGTNLAGMILAGPKYANIFTFDTKNIFQHAYARWIDSARRLIDSNTRCADDILHAFTREFHGNLVRLDPKKGPTALLDTSLVSLNSTKGKVAGRVEYDVTPGQVDYYLDLTTFKRFCAERNLAYSKVRAELAQTMAVSEVRKDLLARTGGPTLRAMCLLISQAITDHAI